MENFCRLNKFVYPCNAQNNNFYNSIMCCCRVIQIEDACGFIAETASFYVTVESGGSMRIVNTMVITLNICMAICTPSEIDNSAINSDTLLLVVMVLLTDCKFHSATKLLGHVSIM